ncbi:MAG: flippase-like domain-containing protein, partial [Candidatus Omnitrophica bacterium]|nr:flippase-like domain-containing protein [Candidatus Omnitrophota bacterium]
LTILAYFIFFGQCYILIRLIQINLSYLEVTYLVSITNIISILPITFFGLGVREAGLVYLLSFRNVAAEPALLYSFLLFISFYVINGFFCFLGWHMRGAKCRN